MAGSLVDPYDMAAAARLPRNTVSWRCSADRAVLVVHDLGPDVVGALDGTCSPGAELVHNVRTLRDTCREASVPVAHTVQGGREMNPGVALRSVLDRYGRDQVLLTGFRAHAGCLVAAAGPALAGVQVFSVADAVADLSLADHRAALRAAAEAEAMVLTTGTAIGELLGVLI